MVQAARWALLAVSLLALWARGSAEAPVIGLESLVSGFDQLVGIVHAGDERLFLLEQSGRVRVLEGGRLLDEPFLDLGGRVSCCGERGLLGLAFPPDFGDRGRFFVSYTDPRGTSVLAAFRVSTEADRAEPQAEILLAVTQPFGNHNGGHLAFGPDGFLYYGLGDGGAGGDPGNRAQDPGTLLGKLLRLDVSPERGYWIPADNPFLGDPTFQPEIWALGLRNPWRFSFDRATGDLWIGDVGQNLYEEIDFQPAASSGGENYGWRRMEASACFQPLAGCNDGHLVLPVLEYDHGSGCSVTGGYRYRGEEIPELQGWYLYGDFCSGRIWAATPEAGDWRAELLLETGLRIASFGEDVHGELYVADYGGTLYRVRSGN